MKIEHIAIWTNDIETMRAFYTKYFNAKSNEKYTNSKKDFESYFLTFDDGARLELMKKSSIPENLNNPYNQNIGLTHIAFSVGSKEIVLKLTEKLRNYGFEVVSEARKTGDGYFESCILDPEGNRVEITI